MPAVRYFLAKVRLPAFHSRLPSMPRARVLLGSSCSRFSSSSRLCKTLRHVSHESIEDVKKKGSSLGVMQSLLSIARFDRSLWRCVR